MVVLWCARCLRAPHPKPDPASRSHSLFLHTVPGRPFLSTSKNPRRPIRQTHPTVICHLVIAHFRRSHRRRPPSFFFLYHSLVPPCPHLVLSCSFSPWTFNPPSWTPITTSLSRRRRQFSRLRLVHRVFTVSPRSTFSLITALDIGSSRSAPHLVALSGG